MYLGAETPQTNNVSFYARGSGWELARCVGQLGVQNYLHGCLFVCLQPPFQVISKIMKSYHHVLHDDLYMTLEERQNLPLKEYKLRRQNLKQPPRGFPSTAASHGRRRKRGAPRLVVEGASDLALNADADVITVLHGDTVTQSFVPAPGPPIAAPWSAESWIPRDAPTDYHGDPWGSGWEYHWPAAHMQAAEGNSSTFVEVPRPEEQDYVALYVQNLNTLHQMFESATWTDANAITEDVIQMWSLMREMDGYLNHIISQGKCVPEELRVATSALSATVTGVCDADWEAVSPALQDFEVWRMLKESAESLRWNVQSTPILRIHPWGPWM